MAAFWGGDSQDRDRESRTALNKAEIWERDAGRDSGVRIQ